MSNTITSNITIHGGYKVQLTQKQIWYHVSKRVRGERDNVVVSTSDRHTNMLLSQDREGMTFGVIQLRGR